MLLCREGAMVLPWLLKLLRLLCTMLPWCTCWLAAFKEVCASKGCMLQLRLLAASCIMGCGCCRAL